MVARLSFDWGLARAAPFADVDPGTWEWVDRHSHGSRSQIQQTITDLAARVAEQAVAAGDPHLALWATEQGLHATPDSDTLHRLALRAAALDPDPDRLVRTWAAINRRLHSVNEVPGSDLTDLFQDLRRQTS